MNAKRQAIQALKDAGYILARHGANHDIYFNKSTGSTIPLRHHFTDADLKIIKKEIQENGK